ncbi:hypothetical protein [uncultured Aureimonas sp.]|uniref:hypothetical protein n=1 Tax=uncultured Aureimonas sp. TaxID=1604662 RepID=UPI0026001591|nr:hypothetical protein [uncultured Aureimonas sp.]
MGEPLAAASPASRAALLSLREAVLEPAARAARSLVPPVADRSYETARGLQAAGRLADAGALLGDLLDDPAQEEAACLGLAVLALERPTLDEAGGLARHCLDRGSRVPRACAIAGLEAFETGDETGAQRLLSAAARLARGRAEWADDLRGAQRVLLLMQMRAA